jgi:putative acetyltransferase
MQIDIKPISPEDDVAICAIIKQVFEEHGINRPGTAYYDESLHHLSGVFSIPRSRYFIARVDGIILGGAGIYPTDGLPPDTCELVKMYLLPEARGKGLGRVLIEHCIEFTSRAGYTKIYLESMPELKKAVTIYQKLGFQQLPGALGNSGHYACSIHMLKDLQALTEN